MIMKFTLVSLNHRRARMDRRGSNDTGGKWSSEKEVESVSTSEARRVCARCLARPHSRRSTADIATFAA